MEQSQTAMNRLNGAVEELIKVIGQQKQDFDAKLINEKNRAQAAENRAATLEAQNQVLNNENEKLKAELISAQNNTETADKLQELQAETEARAAKINGLQTEVQNLNTALDNRKRQIEELNNKNNELSAQLIAANNKINELENNSERDGNVATELQARLNNVLAQNEELKQNCQQSEERLAQMQQTISQTTENIDGVVAKLEKVLEENGAGNNND